MSEEPKNLPIRRAIFVYEAARLHAFASGAPIVPEFWHMRDTAFQGQFVDVVQRQMSEDRFPGPVETHESWVMAYEKMGWRYGPVRDPIKKTHPDMVPFGELPVLERDKDAVFMTLCEIARLWIRS